MAAPFISQWRFHLLFLAVGCAFLAVLGRLYHLHVVEQDDLAAMALANRRTSITSEARRGEIFDARGHLLASTRPIIAVGVDPILIRDIDVERLSELAAILNMPLSEVQRRALTRSRTTTREDGSEVTRPIRWAPLGTVDEATFDRIAELRIRAVYGNRRFERFYPAGQMAAHVLGFVNREGTAVSGVERFMDFYLRGQNGWKQTEKDGRRRELAQFRELEVHPRDGMGVELTIDLVIQTIVENQIQKLVDEFSPDGVSIIVTEARTGSILALGNYPTFNPNEFQTAPIDHHRNRAITDVLEPGSTFKIVPIAAALEEGLITPETIIDCGQPVVEFRGRNLRLPNDTSRLGEVPVTVMVARSSNRGSSIVGMKLGEERLHSYSRAFGFGQMTHLGLTGEVRGTLHPVRAWDGLTITRLPAGYAVNATPLQIHMATSVIAAGGILYQPRLISRVVDVDRSTVLDFPPRQRHRVISQETADIMADMLVDVVSTQGTARRAIIAGHAIAGKTGTTRKIVDGRYTQHEHIASFSGFFPAHDPRIVITVIVDNARMQGVGFGGLVAAPAFREIAEQIITYLSIPESPRHRRLLANQ